MKAPRSLLLAIILGTSAAGCVGEPVVPPPEPALARYTEAVARGDADAVYALMSSESRRSMSRAELARILVEQKAELGEHAKALTSPERRIASRGRVRYADGEVVGVELRDGRFFIEASSGLPAASRTPAQALSAFRAVLARRSYAGLLRVLSPRTRSLLEAELRSLVDGLVEPEARPIEVAGDAATVVLPGGHRVRLRREDGVWYVEDFD